VAGLGLAATALVARSALLRYELWRASPTFRRFYEGGFQQAMDRREAALILGIRESAKAERVKEAHRRIMIANHPDSGGSDYVATKINEAKELLMGNAQGGRGGSSGSPFS
jgi:DnaJ family protein C protein 19